jgi:hypothetical protein
MPTLLRFENLSLSISLIFLLKMMFVVFYLDFCLVSISINPSNYGLWHFQCWQAFARISRPRHIWFALQCDYLLNVAACGNNIFLLAADKFAIENIWRRSDFCLVIIILDIWKLVLLRCSGISSIVCCIFINGFVRPSCWIYV